MIIKVSYQLIVIFIFLMPYFKENTGILFQKTNFYQVVTKKEVWDDIKNSINDLMDEFGLSESVAFELLYKKQWNKIKAINYVREGGNFDLLEIAAESDTNDKVIDNIIFFNT